MTDSDLRGGCVLRAVSQVDHNHDGTSAVTYEGHVIVMNGEEAAQHDVRITHSEEGTTHNVDTDYECNTSHDTIEDDTNCACQKDVPDDVAQLVTITMQTFVRERKDGDLLPFTWSNIE